MSKTGEMDVIDRPDEHRYELVDSDRVMGFAEYRPVPAQDALEFHHTVIDPAERGRGLGEVLVTGAMADVRRKGVTVRPTCSFVAQWFDQHPDEVDLLADTPEAQRRDAEGIAVDVADAQPDSSAVRTALWRALHVQIDPAPHLLADEIGLAIAAPEPGWQQRRDMDPQGTAGHRLALVARTRFVEDLLVEEGIGQYVLLGAGLDTFAQRHADDDVVVFEVDQPGPQTWKRHRLEALGLGVADHLRLVPVDFESTDDWWVELLVAGFDADAPALVSSSGVSMYITKPATESTLSRLVQLAPGSIVAMTFMYPLELVDEIDRPALIGAARGAESAGTPWLSFYSPEEMASLATDAGFRHVTCIPTNELAERAGVGRSNGARASSGEGILIARI